MRVRIIFRIFPFIRGEDKANGGRSKQTPLRKQQHERISHFVRDDGVEIGEELLQEQRFADLIAAYEGF